MFGLEFWETLIASLSGGLLSLGLVSEPTWKQSLLAVLTGMGFGQYLSRPVAIYASRELQLDFDNYLLCAAAFVLGLLAISIVPALRAIIGRFA
ncbi:peptidase M48, Ste24p [Pseudomonas sp. QL9]|uniref:peptidase M48, Ste24p n=1 Tax=Pseudomonas TaxID=286 RepID=UPI0013632BFB|nr:peptidase M48, Ste24p [Pseudomonas knackmussii]